MADAFGFDEVAAVAGGFDASHFFLPGNNVFLLLFVMCVFTLVYMLAFLFFLLVVVVVVMVVGEVRNRLGVSVRKVRFPVGIGGGCGGGVSG